MDIVWMIFGCTVFLAVLVLVIARICFCMAFYASRKEEGAGEEYPIPPGEIYEPHRDAMVAWMKETRSLPHDEVYIRSFDGLKLRGNYYEYAPGATIELMFHGYRGNAERDLCGGVQRCFALERSAFVVDQRACGKSEGNVITFGIRERHDCMAWVDYLIGRFGPDVKIILTGISMGAATVMMAGGMELPENVIGIIADCGYTSPKDIIKKVITQLKLPANLLYPFVKLGARVFGGFDLEETSPVEALKKCRVPVFFAHGEADDFVPCEMSRLNCEACSSPTLLLTVPGAGHGLGYLMAPEAYREALRQIHK